MKLVESDLCTFDDSEAEDLQHLFSDCRHTDGFWLLFANWRSHHTAAELLLNYFEIIFGDNVLESTISTILFTG